MRAKFMMAKFNKKHAFNEISLTTYVANFKLLSKTQSNYLQMQKPCPSVTILQ